MRAARLLHKQKRLQNGVLLICQDTTCKSCILIQKPISSLTEKFGYGYQIWMIQDNGFAFRGMGSQFAFCFPDKDFIFACIADTQGAGPTGTGIEDAFREEIYSQIKDSPLPDDANANSLLKEKIKSLKILPQRGNATSSYVPKINGKWYHLHKNPMGISRMRFIFQGEDGIWEYENASGEHQLRFGIGKKVEGPFPQKKLFRRKK